MTKNIQLAMKEKESVILLMLPGHEGAFPLG
jgi:hypothetical protein